MPFWFDPTGNECPYIAVYLQKYHISESLNHVYKGICRV